MTPKKRSEMTDQEVIQEAVKSGIIGTKEDLDALKTKGWINEGRTITKENYPGLYDALSKGAPKDPSDKA